MERQSAFGLIWPLMEENVFEPAHYVKEGGVECIDVMVQLYGSERVREWAEITAFKYQWRQGNKEGNSSEQDKMKNEAAQYLKENKKD